MLNFGDIGAPFWGESIFEVVDNVQRITRYIPGHQFFNRVFASQCPLNSWPSPRVGLTGRVRLGFLGTRDRSGSALAIRAQPGNDSVSHEDSSDRGGCETIRACVNAIGDLTELMDRLRHPPDRSPKMRHPRNARVSHRRSQNGRGAHQLGARDPNVWGVAHGVSGSVVGRPRPWRACPRGVAAATRLQAMR